MCEMLKIAFSQPHQPKSQNGRYRKLVTRIYGKQLFCFSPILPWQFCVISCFLNLLNGDFAKNPESYAYLDTIGAHFNIIDSS